MLRRRQMYESAGWLIQPIRSWTTWSAGSRRSRSARAACPPWAEWPSVIESLAPPAQPDVGGPRRASTAARSAGLASGAMTWISIACSVATGLLDPDRRYHWAEPRRTAGRTFGWAHNHAEA